MTPGGAPHSKSDLMSNMTNVKKKKKKENVKVTVQRHKTVETATEVSFCEEYIPLSQNIKC